MDYIKLMKDARKKQERIRFNSEVNILKAYKKAVAEIEERIKYNIKHGYGTEYYIDLENELKSMVDTLNKDLNISIIESMNKTSEVTMHVQITYNNFVYPADIAYIANKSLKKNNYDMFHTLMAGEYYKDGKSLNERIWTITNKNKNDIEKLISTNIANGANSRTLAQKLNNYVNPTVKTKAETLVNGMNRDISYQAQRLARTSITQIANETNRQNAQNNPFCMGLKWNLSASHYERQIKRWGPDICDVYATQNNFGLGTGVFPVDEYPVSHPNCLCYSTQIQPDLDEVISRVNSWIDGSKDERLEKAYQKWKATS